MDILDKYGYRPSEAEILAKIETLAANLDGVTTPETLKSCFAAMDLTTLKSNDTPESVLKLVRKANGVLESFPGYPLPASVCVYPNFASIVKDARVSPDLHVTTVAGCFPTSQSYVEVKCLECAMAVRNGADEIDIVLALNAFLAGDCEAAADEIRQMRAAIDAEAAAQDRRVVLKVILETGLLVTPENIARASFVAMEAGADFIKTSTGKVDVNATPMAAYVMCESIARFHEVTGRKVGFKAAGGISTAKDAMAYYMIVSSVLGSGWLDRDHFRLGVSRLGNNLISAIEQKNVAYF